MNSIAITNVKVFDGTELSEPKTVVIEEGLISSRRSVIGKDVIVDGNSGTLLPGFIDSHIHLDNIDNLKQSAKYGVTTMLDMANDSSELVDRLRDQVGLTDIRSCYLPACSPDSTLIENMGYPDDAIVTSSEEAKCFVDKQVTLGADYIKVILEEPEGLSLEIVAALVNMAHRNNKLVFAHTVTPFTYKKAIEAGVDVLNHIPIDSELHQSIIDLIVAEDFYVIPTMVMLKGIAENVKKMNPKAPVDFHNAEISLNKLIEAGAIIIAGTDANRTNDLSNIAHGSSLHEELELIVNAGMTPVQAIQSATSLPAKLLGFEDRGVIEAGRRADLVLVDGDPTADIKATREIQDVWIGGIQV